MIGEILNLANLITADLNETFIHCDAQKYNDVVITATIMKKDNLYLITESKTLSQPIVCNIDRDFKKSKFVFISPRLNQIIWINHESKYYIISITKLLKFINPEKIEGIPENSPFNLSSFFHSNTSFQLNESRPDIKGQLTFQVLSASWWEPNQSNSFVVFAEKNGIHILHVNHPESSLKSYPHNDISHILFNRSEDKLNVTLFTSISCHLYTYSYENGSIVLNQQYIPLQFNPALPFFVQQNSAQNVALQKKSNYQSKYDINNTSNDSLSSQNNNWLYYILQGKLSFFDSDYNDVEITEFQSDSKTTTSIIITRHLIFYCDKCDDDNYKVFARFINPDHNPIVILEQKADIYLISFDDDEVFLNTQNSIIHVSLKKEMIDDIFARLVFNKHLDDAIFIGTGLQLSIPYLFQYIINEYVKQKNYTGAFEIMQHEKCDLRDTLLRFLQNGLDRLALHVALTNHKQPMIEKSIPLFADRVILKNSAFYSFTRSMEQIFGKTNYLLPPEEFSKSSLFSDYKSNDPKLLSKIPLALQFRYNISFGIENDDIDTLKSASKIDLHIYRNFSLSAAYKSLLNQYRAMIDTKEVLITKYVDQICTNLAFFQDSVIFLSDKLYIGNQPVLEIPFEISSFAVKGKTLYVTDQLLNVYKTELPRIDFIEMHDIHPSMKIESNDEIAVFLSISGDLFFENGDSVDGEYIDIALGKDYVYAVDDQGDFYSISIQGQEADIKNDESRMSFESDIINTPDGYDCSHLNNRNNKVRHEVRKKLTNHFIHAVAAAENVPILIASRELIIIDSKEYKIAPFECSTSGREECYIGGSGNIIVINQDGVIEKTIEYNQRIGSLISIKKSKINGNLILLGSASSPMELLNEPIPSVDNPSFGELKLIASSRYNEKFLLKLFDKDPFRTFFYAIFAKWDKISECSPAGIKSLQPYINDFSEEGASHIFHSLLANQQNKSDNDNDQHQKTENLDGISYHISSEMIKSKYARKNFLENPDDLKKLTRKQLFSILPEPSTIRDISSNATSSSHGQISLMSLEKSSSSAMILSSKSIDKVPKRSISESSRRIKFCDKNIIELDSVSEKLLQWSVHPTIVPSRRFKEGKLFVFNCNHILNSNEMLQNVNQVKKLLNSKKLPNTEKLVFNVYLLPKIPAQCPKCLLQRLEAYFK